MRCPKCGKLWNDSDSIISRIYLCPFCGEAYDEDGYKRDDICKILMEIVEKYDEDILQDVNRVNALLMDLAPTCDKERKLIIMCLREGILTQLYTVKQKAMPEVVINRCIKQLISDIWITEKAARYAVGVIAKVVGVNFVNDMQTNVESNSNINSVILLKGDKHVFGDLELERALENVEVVGYKAFTLNNEITNVKFPQSVKKIMSKAFANCHRLSLIECGSDIEVISTNAFDGCESIRKIKSENEHYVCKNGILIDKKERKTIKSENDENSNQIDIPNGICVVTNKTFEGNNATTIKISETVEVIEERAFMGMNNLQRIEVDVHNKKYCSIDGILHDRKGEIILKYPMCRKENSYFIEDSVEEIGKFCFSFAQNLRMITFTGSLKKIDYGAFQFCGNLESLMIPYGVSVIGEKAFQYCIKLRSIMLSRKIIEIDDCAFFQCSSLESVSVPESVERIGNYAFCGCCALKNVTIQNNVKEIGYGAFEGCTTVCIKIKNNSYVENYCKAHNLEYKKM